MSCSEQSRHNPSRHESSRTRWRGLALSRPIAGLSLLAAATLLAGCLSTYGYRSGDGDYYYAEPQVDYYGYGPYGSIGYGGDWYGSVTFRYGAYPYYGGYPYGRHGRYGYPYGGYGYYHYNPYFYGYRPAHPRPPRHPPHQRPPGEEPPPGNEPRTPVALRGSQPRLPPRAVRYEQPQPQPQARPPAAPRPASPQRPVAPSRPVSPAVPVAPMRQAPPPPPPRPTRAVRPVREIGHEP